MDKKERKILMEKEKTGQPKTLLKAMENIVEESKNSRMSDLFKAEVAEDVQFLCQSFGITEDQAILFSICMEKGPKNVNFDDLAEHLNLKKIRIFSYAEDIDALVHRRLLRYRNEKSENSFDVPAVVVKALKHNEVFTIPKHTNLGCYELFDVMNQLFEDRDDDAISQETLYVELQALFNDNPQVDFVKKVQNTDFCNREDWLLLLFFCHMLINKDDDDIRFGQIEDVFESRMDYIIAKNELRSGEHNLMLAGLIENVCEDGIASTYRFKLTEHTKRNLLSEIMTNFSEKSIADVIKAGNLAKKEMFYAEENRKQIDELQSFLTPERYDEIRERMQKKGFRTGFACLFYGGPGTGKTETAYQLARETGRDIMIVDVPQVKSKWVGDSEKNIKAIFDRYREQVKRAEIAPILLFNEADAIIGIRMQGAERAVDKMENSIQNIILQEMETLDGIMIATTNLTQNLDKAFERRFLYKIKFNKPTVEARTQIWHSMIPELSDKDVLTLASNYDLSGGQIENIARHYAIDNILNGQSADVLPMLIRHCDNERLDDRSMRKIGF